MRELRFRAWHEKLGRMFDDVCVDSNGTELLDDTGKAWWIGHEHIMQFTGLKDKNGKEIYEGDIVKMCWQYDGFTNYDWDMTGEVIYNQQDACFMVMNKTHAMHFESTERDEYFPEETEVIGNIYDNPELLNVPSEKGK